MASASKPTRNNLRPRTAAALALLLGMLRTASIAQTTGDDGAPMPPASSKSTSSSTRRPGLYRSVVATAGTQGFISLSLTKGW